MLRKSKHIAMKINIKEPSEIEAQTAAFLTSDHVPGSLSYQGMAKAAKNLVKLSLEGDDHEEQIALTSPYALESHIKGAKQAYSSFLTEQSSEERSEMKQLAPYVARFESFRPDIKDETFYIKNLIGEGEYSKVFRLSSNGEEYALRVPSRSLGRSQLGEIHKHLRACLRVADLDHVEHLEAASYTEGFTVSKIAPGVEVSKLSPEEFEGITHAQIKALHDTVKIAHERNVSFDAIGRNLFYDPEAGFTAIDLGVIESDYQKAFYSKTHESVAKAIRKGLTGVIRKQNISDITVIARLEDEFRQKVDEALETDS